MGLSEGTRLGPYEIIAPLGAGGMGEVYRARDARLGRDVAIKVLPEAVAGEAQALARFESEARAVASLSHPNILDLHDVGEEGGVWFVVTELLEGETLRELLGHGSLPPRKAIEFGLQIAEGLAAAHEKGIVHRDLKPENIFITSDERIKILDFGLARRTKHEKPEDLTSAPTASKRTEAGVVVGTVGYMSPEQVKGLVVDHRSDLFSFGAILYEMLSGRRAFRRDSNAETMAAILRDEPPTLRGSAQQIPPALDHVVNRCLEKSVERRFQSARDIAFALSEASESPGSGVGEAGELPARLRRRLLLPVATGLVLLLGVAGVLVLLRGVTPASGRPTLAGPSIAVLPFINVSGDSDQEYFSDGLAEEVMGLLAKVEGLHVAGRTSSFSFRGKNANLDDIGRQLHVAAVLEGSVRRSGDQLRVATRLVDVSSGYQLWAETYDRKMTDVFVLQDEIAFSVVAALKLQFLSLKRPLASGRGTSSVEAYNHYLLGRHFVDRENPDDYRRSIDAFQKAVALDPRFAGAWAGLAISEARAADISAETSADLFEGRKRALAAVATALSLDPDLAEGYAARSYLRVKTTWDWNGALADVEEALSLRPGDADTHLLYGNLLACTGRMPDAMGEVGKAIDLDPLSADAWTTSGSYLKASGRFSEARKALERAIAIVPDSDEAHSALGEIFLLEGNPNAALLEFGRREVREATRLMGTAMAEHDLGHPEESRQALEKLTARFGGNWAIEIADVYAWCGQKNQAFEWLDRAYEQRDGGLPGIKVDPFIARLQGDPRYGAVLRRIGLSPG